MDCFLNDNQKSAVQHGQGSMMVLAGPGSGKTTVITHRLKNLITSFGVAPHEILVITFTKASAKEMQERFYKLMPGLSSGKIFFGTFHSLFYKIISSFYGYNVNNILKDEERKIVLKELIANTNLQGKDEEDFLNDISWEIAYVKNELIDLKYHNSLFLSTEEFHQIYKEYENYKKQNQKIDFDDMMLRCFKLLTKRQEVLTYWQTRYKYILIDEFQDINKVQYECIKLLAKNSNNLFIVGDDDQSIYKFRGARPEFLLNFPKHFEDTKKVILNINYRSTDPIINICNLVISKNSLRYKKDIVGTNKVGKKPILLRSLDISGEAFLIGNKIKVIGKTINYKEIAVIYRTNIQARAFIDAFLNLNIPFQVKDEAPTIYEHWVSKDIISYMRLALDHNSNDDFLRIINKPSRYISNALIAACKNQGGNFLKNLYNAKNLENWQISRIEEFIFYLKGIKNRNPYDAFKYIRQGVGYDDHIRSYSDYRKMNSSGLYEILDELQESAKNHESLSDYINHVETFVNKIKTQKLHKNEKDQEGVVLTTMHSAKGLEFHTVFLASAVETIIPHEKCKTESEIEEERRLFYVGLTRAKEQLYISIIKNKYLLEVKPTIFLNEIIKIEK